MHDSTYPLLSSDAPMVTAMPSSLLGHCITVLSASTYDTCPTQQVRLQTVYVGPGWYSVYMYETQGGEMCVTLKQPVSFTAAPMSHPPVPVELNVYDLLHPENPEAVPNLNFYLYAVGMGLYHSGVSVHGCEYAYGGHAESHTGVFSVRPRKAPDARFREAVYIGNTCLSPDQVADVVDAMASIWRGNTYNLLSRNCNHFASDLCERLTGHPAPEWVNRLAWMGEKAKFLLPNAFETPTVAPVTAAAAQAAESEYDRLMRLQVSEGDDDFLGETVHNDPDHQP